MPIAELVLRLAIAFSTLLALTRLMGRKEISQMTFLNFVSHFNWYLRCFACN
ncbi:hypothetical protein [Peribacillus asahii]|uniref:hypothetical protein n=1 Tax=Peribacillus asahii TaxID=228899 RepID=UPI00338E118E